MPFAWAVPRAVRRSRCPDDPLRGILLWFLANLSLAGLLIPPGVARAQDRETEYQEIAVVNGGAVAGRVRYTGDRTSGTVAVKKDTDTCGTGPKSDRTILVNEAGGLTGVVVSLADITAGRARNTAPNADMDIVNCEFQPHVTSVTLGGKLTLRNGDGILHRPRGDIGDIPVFQWGMPLPQRLPKKIRHVGRMRVRCTLHPWAGAWVVAFAHPYHAVTDADGNFRMTDIPAGDYTLRFWHEIFGEETRAVTVAAGDTATVNLTYE